MTDSKALRGWVLVLTGVATAAAADTLVLRDGTRVEGTLVGVSGDSIEFEEGGWLSRVRRYDRSDVRRIEIEEENGRSDDHDTAGMRERTVTVSASAAWTDTGVEVREGQDIFFKASGKVRWGPDRRDGPAGEGGRHFNANRPLPDRPGAALIGRIGEGRDIFFIGDDAGPIRAREEGRLYLGVNDDYLQDNSGSFRVTVYY
jgi:hypothetical protein